MQSWRDDRQKYFNSIVNHDPRQKNAVNLNNKKHKLPKSLKKKILYSFGRIIWAYFNYDCRGDCLAVLRLA